MRRIAIKALAEWPGRLFWVVAAIIYAAAVFGAFWMQVFLSYPPIPAGDSLFYVQEGARLAIERIVGGWTGTAEQPRLLSNAVHWAWAGLLFIVVAGPVISALRVKLSLALFAHEEKSLVFGTSGIAEQVMDSLEHEGRLIVHFERDVSAMLVGNRLRLRDADIGRFRQAAAAYFLDDDDLENYRRLVEPPMNATHVFAQISHPALRRRAYEDHCIIDCYPVIFSQSELLARWLLRQYPPLWLSMQGTRSLVLLGWSKMARSLLSTLQKQCHFASIERPKLIVLDEQPDKAREDYRATFAALDDFHPASFCFGATTDSARLFEILQQIDSPAMLYACHGEASARIACLKAVFAVQLADEECGCPIFALAADDSPRAIEQIASTCAESPLAHSVSLDMDTVGDELYIQHRLDRLAVAVHENYVRERLDEGFAIGDRPAIQHWQQLPLTFREENRNQADHHWIKLRELGLYAQLEGSGGAEGESSLPADNALIEALARAEHDRWWCSRLSGGWKFAAIRDDARLLHPNLVPWDHLPEDVREYDREAVRGLPDTFAQAGFRLRRIVDADSGGSDDRSLGPDTIALVDAAEARVAESRAGVLLKGRLPCSSASDAYHAPVFDWYVARKGS
jgi:hypothetical protein